MEKRFPREMASLNSVFDYIAEFMSQHGIDNSESYSLQFVVEELFTNLMKYNRGGRNEIAVSLQKDQDSIVVQLTDFDVDEFDVTKVPDAKTDQPLEERKIGGLGVHLVRKMVDGMRYEYSDRVGRIIITKNLGRDDVQR
jgi:anti-sigma regulatory factor (Ser/Thr protein kinase)